MFKLNLQAWKWQPFTPPEESQLMQFGFSTSWKIKLLDKFHTYYNIETKGTLVLVDKWNRGKTHKSALEGREELESRKDKENGQALWLSILLKAEVPLWKG